MERKRQLHEAVVLDEPRMSLALQRGKRETRAEGAERVKVRKRMVSSGERCVSGGEGKQGLLHQG